MVNWVIRSDYRIVVVVAAAAFSDSSTNSFSHFPRLPLFDLTRTGLGCGSVSFHLNHRRFGKSSTCLVEYSVQLVLMPVITDFTASDPGCWRLHLSTILARARVHLQLLYTVLPYCTSTLRAVRLLCRQGLENFRQPRAYWGTRTYVRATVTCGCRQRSGLS